MCKVSVQNDVLGMRITAVKSDIWGNSIPQNSSWNPKGTDSWLWYTQTSQSNLLICLPNKVCLNFNPCLNHVNCKCFFPTQLWQCWTKHMCHSVTPILSSAQGNLHLFCGWHLLLMICSRSSHYCGAQQVSGIIFAIVCVVLKLIFQPSSHGLKLIAFSYHSVTVQTGLQVVVVSYRGAAEC